MPCALNYICHQHYCNWRTGTPETRLHLNVCVCGSPVHSHRWHIIAMLTYICMTLKGEKKKELTSLISISFEKGGKFSS